MIPNILLEHKEELDQQSKDSVLIIENEIGYIIEDPSDLKKSKYLGHPFIPKKLGYPKDKKGNFLIPTIQLNFSEIPDLIDFPDNGLLQIFFPQDQHFKEEDIIIRYITAAQLELPHITDFSFLTIDMYKHILFKSIYTLSFKQEKSWASATDSQYSFKWDELKDDIKLDDYLEDLLLEDEDKYDLLYDFFIGNSMGSKLGGYGYFVHGDLRAISNEYKDHILLLQIDGSDENTYNEEQDIYIHFYISKKDIKNLDFSNIKIDWQITD